MVKDVVITVLVLGKYAYWLSRLADNDNLSYAQISDIIYRLPETKGGFQILWEFLQTKDECMEALQKMLSEFDRFLSPKDKAQFSKKLLELTGEKAAEDDDFLSDDTAWEWTWEEPDDYI